MQRPCCWQDFEVPDRLVVELAQCLRMAGLNDPAETLEDAYADECGTVALTISDSGSTFGALDDCPYGALGTSKVLLPQSTMATGGRAREPRATRKGGLQRARAAGQQWRLAGRSEFLCFSFRAPWPCLHFCFQLPGGGRVLRSAGTGRLRSRVGLLGTTNAGPASRILFAWAPTSRAPRRVGRLRAFGRGTGRRASQHTLAHPGRRPALELIRGVGPL